MLLVIGTLAGYVVYQQIAMPYNEFEGSALSSAEAAPLLITSLALAVLGVWRMVAEFMPRAAGRRADPDAQLHYEKNTKALKHESFFTYEPLQGLVLPADRGNAGGASEKLPGTMRSLGTAPSMKAGDVEVESLGGGGCCSRWPRLRPQVWAVIKLTTFWVVVFGAKVAFAVLQLVPTLLTAHSSLTNAFPVDTLDALAHEAGSGDDAAVAAAFAASKSFALRLDAALLLASAWASGCGRAGR